MEIHKFIKSLNQLGFVLIVKNDKLVLKGNKKQLGNEYVNSIKENDEIINYIKSHKQELIDYISSGNGNAVADLSGDITSVYRLSGLQEGMLFHGLYNGELSGYVEQFICDLLDLDVALFEASWDYLFRRHSILRSSFHYDELQIPVQCVHREVRLPLTLLDYREKPVSEHEDLLESYRRRDYEQGIDFKSAPLMRISLIRLSEERYRMIWTHHHILTDGWSISILIGELLKSYDQLLSGQELPEVREDRYEDYIRYLEGIDSASAETYWRGYVSGLEGGTLLPFISRGSQERNRGGLYKRKELLLDASTSRQIERYTQGHRITVNTLMQGVWSYLLHRYTGNPHISYGVTVSGRPDDLGGIEERVGMYINTIPLHSVLEEDKGIAEWLQGIQSGQLQSLEYQYTPLSSIQKWSGIAGDMFDSLLVFENYPVSSVVGSSGSGLRVEGLKTEEHSNYLLNISVVSSAEIRVTFDYNTELLPDSDMENIRGHFEKVLQEIVSGEKLTVGTLEMLSAPELGMIVEEFNSTATVYPSDVTVVDLFESQVLLSGSSVAVVYEGESLSYSELDARSNALGHYLRSRGVREDTLVGICIDRSLEMIVGLLGILKAGGAYVPIDPDYPQDRIAYMLEDTGSRLLLSSSRVSAGLSMVTEAEVVELDRDWAKIASYGSLPVERSLQPTHLAYVIYTSGSTGTPKGVMVEHRSIVRLVRNTNYISITKEDRILSLSNFVFDGYTFDIYGALLNGASIVIPDKIVFLDLSMLNNIIIKNNVTIFFITTALFNTVAESYLNGIHQLKQILFGGELVSVPHVVQFKRKYSIEVTHVYGPTESTTFSSCFKIEHVKDSATTIPIGRPISNTEIYILDKAGRVQPVGVPGELYIGGAGVARGYLNRPELTSERFVPNPYSKDRGSRLYRTGDQGRWLADGNIEYLGRLDDQVKIRGYRIELGEIESVLQQCPGVQQGVVLARPDAQGNRRLVGYVVAGEGYDQEVLRTYLQSKLPEYMVPSLWVELASLPLTSNGKTDRRSLPDPDLSLVRGNYEAPVTELEEQLAQIWQELLGVERVGVHDNFFELGGHSLLAIRLVSAIRNEFRQEVAIRDLFKYSTIRSLSGRLSSGEERGSVIKIGVQSPRPDRIPLSYSQERLWFIDQLEGSVQYHIPWVLRLHGIVEAASLEKSLRTVVNRHEVLRTVIEQDEEGHAYQRVLAGDQWELGVHDMRGLSEDEIRRVVSGLTSSPFELSSSHKLRGDLLRIGAEEHILVLTLHHIASDGWSTPILIRELVELYNSSVGGRPAQLPPLPVQYSDYAIWQREYLSGDRLELKLGYWKERLNGVSPLLLPTDYVRPAVQSSRGRSLSFDLGASLSSDLRQLCQETGTTLFMSLLSVFNVLLSRYSGQDDICVGSVIANRGQSEVEGLIGFFVNTLALRTDLSGSPSFREVLGRVREVTLGAYEHQDVPFERVVEQVVHERDMSRSPLFQVMFVLQNNEREGSSESLSGLEIVSGPSEHTTSKYDLTFTLTEEGGQIRGTIEYCTDLYTAETAERMGDHYARLAGLLVSSPDVAVGTLEMLSAPELGMIVEEFNSTATVYPSDVTVVDLFESQVLLSGSSVAVVYEGESLSYSELDARSNALGHYLRSRGVREDTLVGICIDRSLEMIVGLLGILKAGGAYVPIDPDYPQDRIAYMLEDTGSRLLLSSSRVSAGLSMVTEAEVVELDRDWAKIASYGSLPVERSLQPIHLAYVIYTSGSTGTPKGVMVEHRGLVNFLTSMEQIISFNRNCSLLSLTTYGFDISYLELYLPVIKGGQVIILSRDDSRDGYALADKITHYKPDFIQGTPSTWEMLLNCGWANPEKVKMLTGGEALKEDVKDSLVALGTVWNLYGPTETTIWSAYKKVNHDEKVSIGRPISNTEIYILDKAGRVQPVGVPGELYIGGAGVARGYLNRPELTSERFVPNPYSKDRGSRLYRTGDQGRWLADGNIEYLGRLDDQVKIRGYRIELGEIESVLQQCPGVQQGVVLARPDAQGNRRLVGYVVAGEGYDQEVLRTYLQSKLPEYMVPSLWVELASLPLTSNGKTDRRSLPDPDLSLVRGNYEAPVTELEEQLAQIWQELLGVERVGVHDNFFELGGHSLLAIRLVSAIRNEFRQEVAIRDLFKYSTIRSLSGRLSSGEERGSVIKIGVQSPRPDRIPLSYSQERLWFIDQLEGSVQYHIPWVLRLHGIVEAASLEKSLRTVVNRHEVLRTVIEQDEEGHAYQRVLAGDQWELGVHDMRGLSEDEIRRVVSGLTSSPFELSSSHKLRGDLLRIGAEEHILVLTLHHIASDGWSTPILIRELVELYNSSVGGRPAQLPPLPVQYSDYAIWQREYLSGDRLELKLGYWKERLNGVSPLLLPTDYVRPAVQSSRGRSLSFDLGASLSSDLRQLCQETGTTLFMSLLSVFNVLLSRYSGQDDICVGSVIANRGQSEVEGLIGFFVNTLALRTDLSGSPSFREVLGRVREVTLGAYEHQDVPFERVVEQVVHERDMSRSPLFQVMFVLQNNEREGSSESLSGLEIVSGPSEHTTSKYDLTFTLTEEGGQIRGTIEYCTDLYTAETAERMGDHYARLAGLLVSSPDVAVGTLEMLSAPELGMIVEEFNSTATVYPSDVTVVDLFESQVLLSGSSVAVVYEGESLSYSELDARSNALGHYLRSRGVREDTLVGICIDRSLEMIVGLLGILKAGGAYVPIDPDYPQDRIAYMLEDTGSRLLLSSSRVSAGLSMVTEAEIVELDRDWAKIASYGSLPVERSLQPTHLAYVIYTSGSTGTPKGVMVEHRNVVRLFKTESPIYDFNSDDIWTMFHSFCFDFSVWEMYGALLHGGKLVIVPGYISKDVVLFKDLLHKEGITVLNQTPSAFYVLQESFSDRIDLSIRYVIFGGEALDLGQLKPWMSLYENCKLVNMYGITETTVHVTYQPLEKVHLKSSKSIIGRPIPTLFIYILDKAGRVQPVGVPGELYIGGAGVARGYLNRPELTSERFVPNPYSKDRGSRLYRTGDQGRWLADGNIEYLGRLDDQVKIRGYRIELGEIESVLQQCPGVQQGVVLARPDAQGNRRLVGYVVAGEGYDQEVLRTYLQSKLPEYMVPSLWVELASLPLTSNGKTDRRSLPDPDLSLVRGNYEAPVTELEEQLAQIWQELLGVERVGVHDNFFELGGHSLLAIRLVSAIRNEFRQEVAIRDLFKYSTIRSLSGRLSSGEERGSVIKIGVQSPRPDRIPLSYSQERLWFIDQLEGSVQYHIPWVLRLHGIVEAASLEKSLRTVVNRHEVLRTVIEQDEEGHVYQRVLAGDQWELGVHDMRGLSEDEIRRVVSGLTSSPFELSSSHKLRGDLLRIGAEEHILVLTLHHIASDGWSTPILIRELVELYNSSVGGRPAQLPPLPVQYSDYAIWQREYLSGDRLELKLGYWKERLNGVSPLLLPTDYVRPAVQSSRGRSLSFDLGASLSSDLRQLCQETGTTLFMSLLSVFNVLLSRYSGQDDICVGSVIANRGQSEVEGLIGFFVNTLALRTDLSGSPSFREVLGRVREVTLGAYEHQDVPFERVVEQVVHERDMSRSPLFQVMFVLQNNEREGSSESLSGLEIVSGPSEHTTSKYDLTFTLTEEGGQIRGTIEYCTDLYTAETAERMGDHYARLAGLLVSSPDVAVGTLEMLSAPELGMIVEEFNSTATVYPSDVTVVDLFESQVLLSGSSVAVVYEGESLSYSELDARSNALGHYLRSRGVREDTLVGICIDRSLEMIVGLLGILKAGGAYVPIDPDYPQGRIAYMLEDTGSRLLLSSSRVSAGLSMVTEAEIVELDRDWAKIASYGSLPVERSLQPTHLAYVIYTSGSTGTPKGVMVEHRGLVNRLTWAQEYYGLKKEDVVLQKTSFCFDVSVWEFIWPLLAGSRLVFARPGGHFDAVYLKTIIQEQQITMVHFVPSMLMAFLGEVSSGECKGLGKVLCSGEPLTVSHVESFRDKLPNAELHNLYGPTEASIDVTYWSDLNRGERLVTIPIGRPISNTEIYILDKAGRVQPVGVPGELYIGGAGVARGYLNRPELTSERFVPNPYSKDRGSRLYRTGDQGRWLADGNIEYLGRLDDQVKIRGYRIELGEIESVLQQCPGVQQGVVLARPDAQGNRRLVGYVVAGEGYDQEVLRTYLQSKLPEYMVPSLWVELASLPLTSNGKTDRRSLPDPDLSLVRGNYEAPVTELEEQLAQIWQELLGVERVGVHDNFFELGGDSIISIQLVSRIKRLGYHVQVKDIFRLQTIRGLGSEILSGRGHTLFSGESGVLEGPSGLLPIQEWYLEGGGSSISHFNQSVLLRIDKRIGASELEQSIVYLQERHDSLRFRYVKDGSGWQQYYGGLPGQSLYTEDINTLPELFRVVVQDISNSYQQQLDIEEGDLMRAVLFRTPEWESHNRLLLVVHHLAIDGVSWRILLSDLDQLLSGRKSDLGEKGASYRQWYSSLVRYGESSRVQSQRSYWQGVLSGHKSLLSDRSYQGVVSEGSMRSHTVRLAVKQTQLLLQEVPRVYHTEINDLLLCALGKTLTSWSGSSNIVIGLEGHGRESLHEDIDTSRTVGWFTSLYPVQLDLSGCETISDEIRVIKEQLREIPDKGMGYGVLKYIVKAEELMGTEGLDVVFNYLGQLDNVVASGSWLSGAPESSGQTTGASHSISEKLVINGMIQGGELSLTWSYSSHHYDESTIAEQAGLYIGHLESLISHCVFQGKQGSISTPSDYGLTGEVGYRELDRFVMGIGERYGTGSLEQLYRLSGLQEGMLFHGLYNGELSGYVEQFICDLLDLDVALFEASWDYLFRRHSILRSSFHYDELQIPVQCVHREVRLPLTLLDYREKPVSEHEDLLESYRRRDYEQGIDFKSAPLMRISLIRLSEERYRMIWTHHHILTDGWSISILIGELLKSYDQLLSGQELPEVREDRYEDYIRYLEGIDSASAETYWRGYVSGLEGGTLLPFISRGSQERNRGGLYKRKELLLDASTSRQIERYTQGHRITVNTLMQGVWSYLLHRYTGNPHISYGVTVSGRPDDLGGIEERVGMYINTIPLHSVLEEDKGIAEWLQGIQSGQLQSLEYQYTPLSSIQKWSGIAGDMFDSLLVFENYPVSSVVGSSGSGLRVEGLKTEEHSNYPLGITIISQGEIRVTFNYNTELLPDSDMENIRGHFEKVLQEIVSGEKLTVETLDLLDMSELEELLDISNTMNQTYSLKETVVDLFESQVLLSGSSVAVVYEGESLSYSELDARSNALGHYLRSRGVREDTLVGICIDRSLEMIVGLLGILKAGGAYVPIDPDYPQDRIAYMLEDTGSRLLLSSSRVSAGLSMVTEAEIVELDRDWAKIASYGSLPVERSLQPTHLAYVIYTSGSTGTPKGVMVEHRSLIDHLLGLISESDLKNCKSFALIATYVADAGYSILFSSLILGGTLHVLSEEILLDGRRIKNYVNHHSIDCLKIVPSLWLFYANEGNYFLPRTTIIFGGEAFPGTIINLLLVLAYRGEVYNHYGPTETTIGKCIHRIDLNGNYQIVPIGKPFSNTEIYILDKAGRVQPVGVPGELYIGGAGVARGYLNRPELTSERFVPNPYSKDRGSRLYRTGDQGRWLADGNIEYLGRLDDQVKIRGYRIELGEIESVLQQCPGVQQGVVLARPDAQGNRRLVGYVVAGEGYDQEVLRTYLQSKLPEYMVPSLWVELASLPLTSNGKTDRRSLPDPDLSLVRGNYEAPVTELEEQLAQIWQELLGVERVGVHDNFFELGGHSLLAIRLVSAIRNEFRQEVAIRDLFKYSTIRSLSGRLSSGEERGSVIKIGVQSPRPDRIPLSYSQERLWFIDQLEGSVQYHIPWVLRLHGIVEAASLEKSLRTVVNRHEVLRTVIEQDEEGHAYQRVLAGDQWELGVHDMRGLSEDEIRRVVSGLTSSPFELSSSHKLRGDLLRIGAEEHILVLTLHHIASDGWSTPILIRELVELYNSSVGGRPAQLPPLPVQYSDYAIWQREYLSGDRLELKLGYWKERLNGVSPLLLPTDYVRPAVQSSRGRSLSFDLGASLSSDLRQLCQETGTTLFMSLLSVFNVLLSRYSGQDDICVGSVIANRGQSEVEGLIGFFVNTLALRTDLSGSPSFREVLGRVREVTLGAYEHQDVPFERVVEQVVHERDMSRSPLFQVMFVLQNNEREGSSESLSGLEIVSGPSEHTTSKYDLTFTLTEEGGQIRGTIEYCTDLYTAETAERMGDHYARLAGLLVSSPDVAVGTLEMLSAPELGMIVEEFNSTATVYPSDVTVVDLFESQVLLSGSSVAVVYEGESLSYSELDARSNALGHYLRSRGVREDTLVGICIDRSLEMIVGLLGILKAGGAYVPIDPDYPQDRIAYMLEDTGSRLLLSSSRVSAGLSMVTEAEVVELDRDWAKIASYGSLPVERSLQPTHLAYVIYTSGSTGTPKGVMVEHRNAVNLVYWHNENYEVSALSIGTSLAGFGFDAFGWEIWPYLAKGASIHMISKEVLLSMPTLLNLYIKQNITHSFVNTSLIPEFIKHLKGKKTKLKYLLTGGGQLFPIGDHGLECVLVNNYGPTENTVVATSYKLANPNGLSMIPIGRPISNTEIYILDKAGRVQPVGVPGELYIGGAGVARGYLNRPELTSERFVPNPYSKDRGSRLYRTGDQGRWLADGNIEYLGRLDDQVKIRGYRIELGEIESVLQQCPGVQQGVVLARPDAQGNRRLVGYVVAGEGYDQEVLRTYLQSKLPEYMVPSLWVELASLPLTSNGKTDRRSLPDPDLSLVRGNYEAPVTELEEQLAQIWQELLGVERVGVHDNFFELGGHSLLATRLISRMRTELGIEYSIKAFFKCPNIKQMVRAISIHSANTLIKTEKYLTIKL